MSISSEDLKQLYRLGISQDSFERQIHIFKTGIPPVKLVRAAGIGDGIVRIAGKDFPELMQRFEEAAEKGRLTKFVPASGASTRMFASLIELLKRGIEISADYLQAEYKKGDKSADFGIRFFQNLAEFAFWGDLQASMKRDGLDLAAYLKAGLFTKPLQYLLSAKGLNYAEMPKGLIPFHLYDSETRTPFQEHIIEGIEYSRDKLRHVKIHFTVPPEHMDRIRRHIDEYCDKIAGKYGVSRFEIGLSVQRKRTDTVAVDMDNKPFRDENGHLVFRPGGHGALIENLNEVEADIVFINNIDNVRPDCGKDDIYLYRKILCGYLTKLQERTFDYLEEIDEGNSDRNTILEIEDFMEKKLFNHLSEEYHRMTNEKKIEFLRGKLNRPLRVCGMVKNLGEPGGGPFWTENKDGRISLQIVEGSQVDHNDEKQLEILKSSTHFNPVDLVCGLRDYKGEKFNLLEYIDHSAAFIAIKSKDGRQLKALELPGLWNGAMSKWNTVFVEVPVTTFCPVKTVNDLLRGEHR